MGEKVLGLTSAKRSARGRITIDGIVEATEEHEVPDRHRPRVDPLEETDSIRVFETPLLRVIGLLVLPQRSVGRRKCVERRALVLDVAARGERAAGRLDLAPDRPPRGRIRDAPSCE